MIPRVVPENQLGLAYGLTTAIQNFGLGFGPNLIGGVREAYGNYSGVTMTLACLAGIGLITSTLLWVIDRKKLRGALQSANK